MEYYLLIVLVIVLLFFYFMNKSTKESFHPRIRKFNRNIKNKSKKIMEVVSHEFKQPFVNMYKLLVNKYI
jgi:hypothetical protein